MDMEKLKKDWQLEEKVRQFICEYQCGSDFDKLESCEVCMEDETRKQHFDYELMRAKKLGEDYFRY